MENKSVNVFIADRDLKSTGALTQIDGTWVKARPIGYMGFIWRLRCAWRVWKGKADIVQWYKQ